MGEIRLLAGDGCEALAETCTRAGSEWEDLEALGCQVPIRELGKGRLTSIARPFVCISVDESLRFELERVMVNIGIMAHIP